MTKTMSQAEIQARAMQDTLKCQSTAAGIVSYMVQYDNGHQQSITSKIPLVTEGVIIPDAGQTIKECEPIKGKIAAIFGQSAELRRERVIDEARAQANLAGAFHAIHKLEISKPIQPLAAPKSESYIAFTAVPVFIQR